MKFAEEYVKSHFSTEGKYMLMYGYPQYGEHMKKHGQYVKRIDELKKMYVLEGHSPDFIEHYDKNFAKFMRKKKSSGT